MVEKRNKIKIPGSQDKTKAYILLMAVYQQASV
ncbi:hypothetical protein HBHAL_3061 [Halobacillus halophilus DSM 2266]|uniref:Uncharacterized protein n=1 Tax=Halobacillus halophilus (strain ATCC 35676 / DSM 2266 / JCM 20832 / KCTC 3685 / LMG 17431 / NBRC 102448 / NCIMB 2269) TaxID=866895 RepID=I0JMN8_HALH3|nr:hypothetical protein HBHAL_3061 [Halobacillus halophilus DSM 2266]